MQLVRTASGANQADYSHRFVAHSMAALTFRSAPAGLGIGLPVALQRGTALVAFVLILLVTVGCDQEAQRVAVSGQVLIDGEPLTKGTIRFVPASGRPASAHLSEDGSFRVAAKSLAGNGAEVVGLIPGNYQIAVLATEMLSEAEDAEVRWLVPRHYGDFRTSGLKTDIQSPTDSLIVELTWDGAEETNETTGSDESSIREEDRETLEQQKDNG